MNNSGKPRRFWPISLGIHAVLLGVIFFIPAKQYFQDTGEKRQAPAPPEIKRRGEELEKVMEQVRDIAAERIATKVALLDQGSKRMTANFETMNKYHQPAEERQRETALERMQVFAQRVLSDMSTMQSKLERANQAGQPAMQLAALKEAQPLGSRALVAQEEVRRGLMFIAADDPALVAAQTEVEEIQISAVEFIGWSAGSLNQYVSAKNTIEELRSEEPSLRQALQSAETRAEEATAQLAEARKKLKDLQDKRTRLRKELSEADKAELEKDIQEMDESVRELADAARQTRREFERSERNLNRSINNLEKAQETYRERAEARAWEKNLNLALIVQTQAFNAQRTVINALLEQAGKAPIFTDE